MARVHLGTATLSRGGGMAQVARMSAIMLQEMGHELTIASYLDERTDTTTLPVTSCSGGNRLHFLASNHYLASRADLCLYDSAPIARAHPRHWLLATPYIIWMLGREVWEDLRPDALRRLRAADRVFAISKHTLTRFEQSHGPLPQAKLCPLATLEDEPSPLALSRAFDGPPTILMVGRIDRDETYKGHAEMITAWPAIAAQISGARLVIAGHGSGLPALQAQVAASPVAAQIELLGYVPDDQMQSLWETAWAFALPSRGEGFGLVYVEAMRHGLPIITSQHDAGQELIRQGRNGMALDLDQKNILPEAIIPLLSSRQDLLHMGIEAQKIWLEAYRFRHLKTRFQDLIADYFETCAARPPKSSWPNGPLQGERK